MNWFIFDLVLITKSFDQFCNQDIYTGNLKIKQFIVACDFFFLKLTKYATKDLFLTYL